MTATLRKVVPFAFLLGLFSFQAVALSACNTAEGLGKDVENTGDAMQRGAKNVKEDMK